MLDLLARVERPVHARREALVRTMSVKIFKRVYVVPNTQAHLLPVPGDGQTTLCGRELDASMRWKDDEHVASLPTCIACRKVQV